MWKEGILMALQIRRTNKGEMKHNIAGDVTLDVYMRFRIALTLNNEGVGQALDKALNAYADLIPDERMQVGLDLIYTKEEMEVYNECMIKSCKLPVS